MAVNTGLEQLHRLRLCVYLVPFLPRDAMLSGAVYAVVVRLSVCVCVCLSVTLRYCIKMAKLRIMQIIPHNNSENLVY